MHVSAGLGKARTGLLRILQGRGLEGLVYPAEEILEGLASDSGQKVRVVENAVLQWKRGVASPLNFAVPIQFLHCTFQSAGEVRLQGYQFSGGLELVHCTTTAALVFESCRFLKFAVRDLSARDEVRFLACTFREGFPAVIDCRFAAPTRWEVEVEQAAEGRGRRLFSFDNCLFENDLTVLPTGAPTALQFQHCTLGPGCLARLSVGPPLPVDQPGPIPEPPDLRLEASQMAGRVQVLPHEVQGRSRSRPVWLSLLNSAIDGELDLSGVRLSPLDLTNTSFAGGQLTIDLRGLRRDGVRWRRPPLVWTAADRPGNVLSEYRLDTGVAQQPSEAPELENPYEQIAREYGVLRNAFARSAGAIEHEAFCHYKFKDYLRRAEAWEFDCRWRNRRRRPGPPQNLRALGLLLNDCGAALKIYADLVVWKWMLGYGVYARRVAVTAALTIVICALIYGFSSVLDWPGLGFVADSNGYRLGYGPPARAARPERPSVLSTSEVPGRTLAADGAGPSGTRMPPHPSSPLPPPPPEYAGIEVAIRQSLYFSTVTFTTVGYGDFTPRGRLQYLAALESLAGGVLIAFLTVVFARKFIR